MKKHNLTSKRGKGNNVKGNNTTFNRLTLKNVFIVIGFALMAVILFCCFKP